MPRNLVFAIFIIVATSVFAAMNYYVWARLVRDAQLPARWATVATVVFITLAVLMPLSRWLDFAHGSSVGRTLSWISYGWAGFVFVMVVLCFAGDLLRWALAAFERFGHIDTGFADPERRRFIARVWGGGLAAFGASSAGYGLYEATRRSM